MSKKRPPWKHPATVMAWLASVVGPSTDQSTRHKAVGLSLKDNWNPPLWVQACWDDQQCSLQVSTSESIRLRSRNPGISVLWRGMVYGVSERFIPKK